MEVVIDAEITISSFVLESQLSLEVQLFGIAWDVWCISTVYWFLIWFCRGGRPRVWKNTAGSAPSVCGVVIQIIFFRAEPWWLHFPYLRRLSWMGDWLMIQLSTVKFRKHAKYISAHLSKKGVSTTFGVPIYSSSFLSCKLVTKPLNLCIQLFSSDVVLHCLSAVCCDRLSCVWRCYYLTIGKRILLPFFWGFFVLLGRHGPFEGATIESIT